MTIAITDDHLSLSTTAADLLAKRDARGAARALLENSALSPKEMVEKALAIAGEICIYTNQQITIEALE